MFKISLRNFLLFFLLVVAFFFGVDRVLDYIAQNQADEFVGNLRRGDHYKNNRMIADGLGQRVKTKVWKYLHKKFPKESLAQRLAFENPPKNFAYLKGNTKQEQYDFKYNPYTESLKRLHDESEDEYFRPFPKQEVDPLSSSLVRPDGDVEDLFSWRDTFYTAFKNQDRKNYPADFGEKVSALISKDDPVKKQKRKKGAGASLLSPSDFDIKQIHYELVELFAAKYHLGVYVSREEVTGFIPHRLRLPIFSRQEKIPGRVFLSWLARGRNSKKTKYEVRSVHLVYGRPDGEFVYKSKYLPNLKELSSSRTRLMDAFEQAGWAELSAGKDLVARRQGKTVIAIGAIRAKQWCRKCHATKDGQLMGAFSYELTESGNQ